MWQQSLLWRERRSKCSFEKDYTFGKSDARRESMDNEVMREAVRERNLKATREAVMKREQEDDEC